MPETEGMEGDSYGGRAISLAPTARDLVRGDVNRMVLVLALPVLGEQILTSFVGIFDTFLAGQISKSAIAAVGLAAYVSWLGSLIFALVGTGTTALVARYWGAGDYEQGNRFANQSMTMAGLLGAACLVAFFAGAPVFATLQQMHGETYRIAVRYLRVDGVGLGFMSLCFVGGAALRGVGDMRTPMVIFAGMNLLNMASSVALVYGLGPLPALGVDGIVAGTVIARGAGAVVMLAVLAAGRSGLRLRPTALRLRLEAARRILRVGFPAAGDGAVLWVGHFLFLMIIATLAGGAVGQAYYASHIICVRVEALTYLPAVAWGAAAATLVGQALGAGDRQRAVTVGHAAVRQCLLLGCLSGLLFLAAAGPIYRLMSNDQLVRQIGPPAFRVVAFFQPCLTVSIVYLAALRGAGDTRFPLLVTLVGILLTRLPLAYLLGIVWQGGLLGAWVGMCSDMTTRAVLAAWRYSGRRWVGTTV